MSASYGYYDGMFVAEEMDEKKNPMASNKINLAIDHIEGEKVSGHSIVAGEDTALVSPVADAAKTMALVEACYGSSAAGGTPIEAV